MGGKLRNYGNFILVKEVEKSCWAEGLGWGGVREEIIDNRNCE
jgi:hypothetical protein